MLAADSTRQPAALHIPHEHAHQVPEGQVGIARPRIGLAGPAGSQQVRTFSHRLPAKRFQQSRLAPARPPRHKDHPPMPLQRARQPLPQLRQFPLASYKDRAFRLRLLRLLCQKARQPDTFFGDKRWRSLSQILQRRSRLRWRSLSQVLQHLSHLRRRGRPVLWLLRQEPHNQRVQGGRDLWVVGSRRHYRRLQVLHEYGNRVIPLKGQPPGRQFVQHHAQSVQVSAAVQAFPHRLLGRDILHRTQDRAIGREPRGDRTRQTKIDQLGCTVGRQ